MCIAHSGWLRPLPEGDYGYHCWHYSAYKKRGYIDKGELTPEQLDLSATNPELWKICFADYDDFRRECFKGKPHWLAAPSRLGSLLIEEVANLADVQELQFRYTLSLWRIERLSTRSWASNSFRYLLTTSTLNCVTGIR